jgi:hypothetical protein
MTKYERMELDLFSLLKKNSPGGYYFELQQMGRDYNIETRYVREKLIEWADAGLISLEVCTKKVLRPYTEWQSADEFFEEGNMAGHILVKLLVAGDERLERLKEIKHEKIGF